MYSSKKKNWNIFYNLYNAFFSNQYPVSLVHFVTERCNANCPHCFVDRNDAKEELTVENIEKIASTSGNALRNVYLTGGEPFIREDIFEIAKVWYQNSAVKSIAVTTNGSMPDKIEYFVKESDKIKLPVSFFFSYDFIEEKHSEYRNLKDLHLKVTESYNIVRKYYPNMNAGFNITVNADNYESAEDTYYYIRDILKVQNINCILLRGKKLDILPAEIREKIGNVYNKIQQIRNDDLDKGILPVYSDKSLTSLILNAKNKILWKFVLKTFKENKFISPCKAASLFGVVCSNGDVMPCELLNQSVGNLKNYNYDFSACWQSEEASKIRKYIKSSKCFCTYECCWLINIFSTLTYIPEVLHLILNDICCEYKK